MDFWLRSIIDEDEDDDVDVNAMLSQYRWCPSANEMEINELPNADATDFLFQCVGPSRIPLPPYLWCLICAALCAHLIFQMGP